MDRAAVLHRANVRGTNARLRRPQFEAGTKDGIRHGRTRDNSGTRSADLQGDSSSRKRDAKAQDVKLRRRCSSMSSDRKVREDRRGLHSSSFIDSAESRAIPGSRLRVRFCLPNSSEVLLRIVILTTSSAREGAASAGWHLRLRADNPYSRYRDPGRCRRLTAARHIVSETSTPRDAA